MSIEVWVCRESWPVMWSWRGRVWIRAASPIFYSTAWEQAYLHGSVNGGEWRDHKMRRVSDSLRVVHINANQNGRPIGPGTPLLEFVIHNGAGDYDKAPDGEAVVESIDT